MALHKPYYWTHAKTRREGKKEDSRYLKYTFLLNTAKVSSTKGMNMTVKFLQNNLILSGDKYIASVLFEWPVDLQLIISFVFPH